MEAKDQSCFLYIVVRRVSRGYSWCILNNRWASLSCCWWSLNKSRCRIYLRDVRLSFCRGVARGGGSWGARDPPLGRPSFEQTTYNIQVAKTPWKYLGRQSHCWKAHFLKMCFFVKYFRQRLLSLVNMGVEVDMTIWWVASVTPPLKNPGYAPVVKPWVTQFGNLFSSILRHSDVLSDLASFATKSTFANCSKKFKFIFSSALKACLSKGCKNVPV